VPNKTGLKSNLGRRIDGSLKGPGFLGVLTRPDGGISTELSIGVGIGGKETLIPSLVPTLTQSEINLLLKGNKPTKQIINKATEHAMTRIKQGLNPFLNTKSIQDARR